MSVYSASDPYKDRAPSKDMAWWLPNIDHKVNPEVRHLLESYSNITPEDVLPHVYKIREQAWAIRPYPCTGLGGFLSPSIAAHPAYPEIFARVQTSNASVLDLGCYMGTDLRKLTRDGAPEEHLYGADIANYWDLGYELFHDREKFAPNFFEGDLLQIGAETAIGKLAGKFDVIHVTHLLHQWDWNTQMQACRNLAKLASAQLGSVIIGFQCGTTTLTEEGRDTWTLHTPASFRKMWEIVQEETGSRWNCEAQMCGWDVLGFDKADTAYLGDDVCLLRFEVKRAG